MEISYNLISSFDRIVLSAITEEKGQTSYNEYIIHENDGMQIFVDKKYSRRIVIDPSDVIGMIEEFEYHKGFSKAYTIRRF